MHWGKDHYYKLPAVVYLYDSSLPNFIYAYGYVNVDHFCRSIEGSQFPI